MRTISKQVWALLALAAAALALAPSALSASHSQTGFGFNAPDISGFPTGAVFLTGGGAYNPDTGFVHSGGGFRCTEAVEQGKLAGCETGQGVRWDTAELITETITFKCTGEASEEAKHATSDEHTAVLLADFYRAGDGRRRVVHGADDRLTERHRPGHRRRPERLGPGGRLRLGDRALQLDPLNGQVARVPLACGAVGRVRPRWALPELGSHGRAVKHWRGQPDGVVIP